MSSENEKDRILQRDAQWSTVASEGRDVERIVSFWTDDAMVIPPGFPPIVGKEALREYVRTSLQIPGFRISWASTNAQVSPDGRLAYLLGRNSVTMNGPDGQPITMKGRAVTIWRREEDGDARWTSGMMNPCAPIR